jgi:hypothetical protein
VVRTGHGVPFGAVQLLQQNTSPSL